MRTRISKMTLGFESSRAACTGRGLLVAAGLAFGTLCFAEPVHAQDVTAAANAFSRAQKAELAGDHAAAAELYELADSLAPAPEALRSALKARKASGQLGLAAIHAEALLERYADEKRSKELADATLAEAKEKFMRYEMRCKPRACSLLVDGAAAGTEAEETHVLYLEPGKHEVSAMFGSAQTGAQTLDGEAGSEGKLSFDAPPEAKRPRGLRSGEPTAAGITGDFGADGGAYRAESGLPPWVFVTGAVVTVGLGAVTVWSGLDVIKAHDDYEGRETEQAYQEGRDKEKRTNILIGATAAAGVATTVIAIFTNWGGSPKSTSAHNPQRLQTGALWTPSGGALQVEGRF
ncbi:MAG TPA: hypothetical protein VK524_06805 [Polyangiaceae bacterium]|nr:hypothetical protein [Polyangiaceae bacterium]